MRNIAKTASQNLRKVFFKAFSEHITASIRLPNLV